MDRSTSLTAAGLLTALILGAVALRGPEAGEPVPAAPARARAAQPAAGGKSDGQPAVVPAGWITGVLPGARDVSLAARRTAR